MLWCWTFHADWAEVRFPWIFRCSKSCDTDLPSKLNPVTKTWKDVDVNPFLEVLNCFPLYVLLLFKAVPGRPFEVICTCIHTRWSCQGWDHGSQLRQNHKSQGLAEDVRLCICVSLARWLVVDLVELKLLHLNVHTCRYHYFSTNFWSDVKMYILESSRENLKFPSGLKRSCLCLHYS